MDDPRRQIAAQRVGAHPVPALGGEEHRSEVDVVRVVRDGGAQHGAVPPTEQRQIGGEQGSGQGHGDEPRQ